MFYRILELIGGSLVGIGFVIICGLVDTELISIRLIIQVLLTGFSLVVAGIALIAIAKNINVVKAIIYAAVFSFVKNIYVIVDRSQSSIDIKHQYSIIDRIQIFFDEGIILYARSKPNYIYKGYETTTPSNHYKKQTMPLLSRRRIW